MQYLADNSAINGMSGSSPQLSDNDVNNSDTLVVDRRDPVSPSQAGNSASLDAANTGNSPGVLPPRRRERKSMNVRWLLFFDNDDNVESVILTIK